MPTPPKDTPTPAELAQFIIEINDHLDSICKWDASGHPGLALSERNDLARYLADNAQPIAAALSRLSQAEKESEGRRKALLEKSEDVRREWKRGENAEAALSQAEQERDELLALHEAIESHCRVETPETRGNPVAHEAEGKALRKRVQEAIQRHKRSRQQRGI